MTSGRRDERGEVRSPVSWVKLVFFSLSAGSLLQIVFQAKSILPESKPIIYVIDEFNNVRRIDPDTPFPNAAIGNSHPQSQIDSTSNLNSEFNSDLNSNSNKTRNERSNATEPETPSLEPPPPQIPKAVMDPMYLQAHKRIDERDDAQKCSQFGVPVLPQQDRHRKRIFFGAMLADENPEVLAANAAEVYNLYDVIALVESNTTHSGEARRMNFGPGSHNARLLQESELFGSHTQVVIDYWLEEMEQLYDMDREVEQRNTIWKIWLDQGMTETDIGIMADLDEIVSREFLNALQVCDFPKLKYDPAIRPTCQRPKMSLASIQFEASPLCIKTGVWFHPDIILGSCVAGVGDPTGRTIPLRGLSPQGKNHKTLGTRLEEWGLYNYQNYPQDVIENNRFPLWDGRDIREVSGNGDDLINFETAKQRRRGKQNSVYGAAYHLHNWFTDTETLRHKYATYGHSDRRFQQMPLGSASGDLNMMVRCVRDLGNDIRPIFPEDANLLSKGERENDNLYNVEYYLGNRLLKTDENNSTDIFSVGGNRPIYFQNKEYVRERHALLQQMIQVDEEKYGTLYPEEAIRREQKRKKALQEKDETLQQQESAITPKKGEEESPQQESPATPQ